MTTVPGLWRRASWVRTLTRKCKIYTNHIVISHKLSWYVSGTFMTKITVFCTIDHTQSYKGCIFPQLLSQAVMTGTHTCYPQMEEPIRLALGVATSYLYPIQTNATLLKTNVGSPREFPSEEKTFYYFTYPFLSLAYFFSQISGSAKKSCKSVLPIFSQRNSYSPKVLPVFHANSKLQRIHFKSSLFTGRVYLVRTSNR